MNLTPDRAERLRALGNLGFTAAQSEGVLDGSLTPMGVFEFEHRRVDCSNLSGVRHFLATSPTLKRMAAQPVAGWPARAIRTWARKAANRVVLGRDLTSNLVTLEGRNHFLDVVLHGSSQVATWYVAPFEGNYTPVSGLTGANFAGDATECTAYDEATRVAYVEAAASGGVTTNAASRAVFTINASKTLYGAALMQASAKSSTSGVCLAAARFSSSRAVVDNDEVAVSYSLTLTSS